MCKAFSCIATRTKVYWKIGKDSHEDIKKEFKLKDDVVGGLVFIEITPDSGYLHPEGKWTLRFDNSSAIAPDWWKASHEKMCFEALKEWKKEVYSQFKLKEVLNPINPFRLPKVKKVTKTQIRLLASWASVGASVGDSVRDSVRDSVGDSVGDSVWDSVWASVWASVGDSVWDSVGASVAPSVWGYISSLFPKVKFKFDFSSNTKLWKMGLVPLFDGKIWRLHSGPKAKIVYEITQVELQKMKRRN